VLSLTQRGDFCLSLLEIRRVQISSAEARSQKEAVGSRTLTAHSGPEDVRGGIEF